MASSVPSLSDNSPPNKGAELSGFVRLARRLTAWTSNLLATGIVLVLALGGGRQLVRWYQEDPLASATSGSERLLTATGASPAALEVELTGGSYTLRREKVTGPVDAATNRLQQFCRQTLSAAEPPSKPASESERRFLATLADRHPIEEQAGHWRIFQLAGLMPMVIGVHDRAPDRTHSGPPLAETEGRVLAWGIGVPSGQNEWFLYQYQAVTSDDRRASEGFPISLPADSHRTLAVAASGQRTVGLAGDGSPEEWRRHFDQQFHRQGWTSGGWQTAGGGWHARYEQVARQSRADVHFAGDRGRRLHGLVIITLGNHQ